MSPNQIKERLIQVYGPVRIEVTDLTGTNDHYQVFIESAKFEGMSRMQQHRAIMDVFDEELKSGEVHALTIRTALPQSKKETI